MASPSSDRQQGTAPDSWKLPEPYLPDSYLLMWELLHLRTVQRWCRHRSERRRWLPTGGGEWGLLASIRDPTAAFHIIRLLGLRGAAKRRPWQARLPGACHGCGHAVTAIRWTTRTQTHQGLGW